MPNGVDDAATIVANAATTAVLIDRDVTVGSLSVDTTASGSTLPATVVGANGLNLIASSRTGGPVSTLTFQRTSGVPSITVTGGNSLSFSESKLSGTAPGNSSGKLVVVGDQGLFIDNQNPVPAPVAVNSTGVSSTPTYGVGPVRFGFGLDWSKFSGDLVLNQGVFQSLAGGTPNNNLSSLPMASKVVLGVGTNTARLEIPNAVGQVVIRGLEGGPNSSVINTAVMATGSIGAQTIELGSYGLATDSFTYAGNIGDTTNVATVASSPALRLVKVGPGTQILSGVNNLDGLASNTVLVALNGGKLSLGATGAIGTITDGQGAANANSSMVIRNGEFELSGLGVAAPRSQAFGGSLVLGNTGVTTTNPDDKQAAQSSSLSTFTVVADPAQPATLTFGAIRPRHFNNGSPTSNLNGVTMLFRGTNLGSIPGAGVASILFTTAPTVGGGNLFSVSGGALGTAQAPVLKGALADTSPIGHGSGFATYDPAVGVRLLASSEKTTVTDGGGYDAASSDNNIVLDVSADTAITGHQSNTLQINNTSGLARTITHSGTALNAPNGLLFSGIDPLVLTGGQITGTAESDSNDVIIHSINTSAAGVTLQTPISNAGLAGGGVSDTRQGWITYNGPGNFRIEGAQTVGNTGGIVFNGTGVTTLAATVAGASNFNFNQGLVKLDAGASWTNLPRLLLAPEARFDLNGVGSTATTNRYSDINAPIPTAGLTMNPIAGEVTNSGATLVDLILSGSSNGSSSQATTTSFFGTITGNLNLVVDKSTFNSGTSAYAYGTQSLANANTYAGSTQIRSGVLNLARGGRLPTTTAVTLGVTDSNANSTLTLGDSNGSTNGSVRQEIAGLYAAPVGTGTGLASVQNVGANASQLTINSGSGVDNVYTGNLGLDPATVSNGDRGATANLFGLRKIGPGSFEPAGALNNYAGGTIVQGGILRVSSDAKLGQVGLLIGVASSTDAPLAPIGAFANSIILDGGTLQTTTTTDFVLNPKRGIGLGPTSGSTGGTGGLHVDSGVTLTYAGVIASAGNTGSQTLVKNGSGLLLLQGANTFTGVTQVVAGALGGTGSLASGVTVESGGAIAPGVGGLGTLAVAGPLTLKAGSALNVDLGAPGASDLIQLSGGAVSVTGTTTVNVTAGAGFGVGSYTLVSGGAAFSATNFVLGSVPSGYTGTFSSTGGALTLTIAEGSALTGLETWRQTNFGISTNTGSAADAADPDADGLPNLIEYACGTNPNTANVSPLTVAKSGNFLTLTYTRIADTTLTYTVEGSSDLSSPANWTTVTTANNPSTGAMNTAGPVTVTDTVALNGRRFLRLKVSY